MSEPVAYEDKKGEQALAREVELLRRRRWLTRIGVAVAIAAAAAFMLWPASACEQLAQEMCQGGHLHCGRSRAAIKQSLEPQECEAMMDGEDRRVVVRELIARFPDVEYTEAERQQIHDNPRGLP
jgi:hypothetical protein